MKKSTIWILCRWLLAVGVGGAVYLWIAPSAIAALVVGWYVWESVYPYLAALRQRSHRRHVAWAFAVPRATGTIAALALAYLVFLPWEQVIALAYLLLLILEGVYRLALRHLRPSLYERAQQAVKEVSETEKKERAPLWRGVPALLCASLLVVVLPPTLYACGLRQVALDTRFYVAGFTKWALYDQIVPLAGNVAVDAAVSAVRKQGPEVRRAFRLLTKEDKAIAAQTLFPAQWTEAVVEQALEATVSWMRSADEQRVPSISLPVHDIERHVQEAVSVLLDRHIAALPVCAPDTPPSTFCRPAEMSLAAYTATYKPEAMAAVDKAFALLPAELDLATAVTLSPRTFQRSLAVLAQVRTGGHDLDRALAWTGVGCLLAWTCLWLFFSGSLPSVLCWNGVTLFVVAGRTWAYGWAASAWPRALAGQYGAGSRSSLPAGLVNLPWRALSDLARSTHALLSPWVLFLAAVGLVMALLGSVRLARSPRAAENSPARVLMITLAAGFLFCRVYLDIGRGLYGRAYMAHRQGNAAQAIAGYRQVERWYPLPVDAFVERTRRRMRECQRYQEAEDAYRAGEYESAVQGYEALLVGNPTIALRSVAQAHLAASLYAWAESLQQAGEYERALDRYRFLGGEFQGQQVQQALADLYMAWGKTLQQDGDYRAAAATYRRMTYDVLSPRLLADADEQIANVYCEWAAALRAKGHDERAGSVCEEFLKTPASAAGHLCPACAVDNPHE